MIEKECSSCGKMFKFDETRKDTGMNEEGHFFGKMSLSFDNDPFMFKMIDPKENKKWILPKIWNKIWSKVFYWVDTEYDSFAVQRSCPIWEVAPRIIHSWIKELIHPTEMGEIWECNECYNNAKEIKY
jgi:hypothetical protein